MIYFESLKQQDLTYLRDLLFELTTREIKIRYKRSILGIVWSLLHSLAQIRIFRFLFGTVLALNIPNYTAFLFIGVLVWAWFRTALTQGTVSITNSRELVNRPGFPVAILPIVTVTTSLIDFLLAFPILVIFLIAGGSPFSPALLLFPLIMIIQFVFTLGLAYLLATIQVRFRDMSHLLNVALSLGFYLTPIFYDVSAVPAQYRFLYTFNPLVYLLDAYRAILIYGQFPDPLPLFSISLLAGAMLFGSYTIFIRASYGFSEEL